VNRGDIYTFNPKKHGAHEIQGKRFAVVLQSDSLLNRSIVIVAPTSQSARSASVRPDIHVQNQPTKVLVEQMTTVSIERLGKRVDRVDIEDQWAINDAIAAVLGLN
jgi:mRNA interferase MazF